MPLPWPKTARERVRCCPVSGSCPLRTCFAVINSALCRTAFSCDSPRIYEAASEVQRTIIARELYR